MKKTLIAMMVIASTSALAQDQEITTEQTVAQNTEVTTTIEQSPAQPVVEEKTVVDAVVETTTEATDVVVEKTEEVVDTIVETTTEATDTVVETSESLWDKFKSLFK
jgi:hypothetical protein